MTRTPLYTHHGAPKWLKPDSLRREWAELNNVRVRVWAPAEAPTWISSRWKRDEWAQEKNEAELESTDTVVPFICDHCGAKGIGIEVNGIIYSCESEDAIGFVRSVVHFQTECVLCVDCHKSLKIALKEFEERWVDHEV